MLSRAWILETLARLPVWAWPVFLWDVFWLERYYRAYRAANPVGLLGIGVTPGGRIVITLQAAGDTPDAGDWTHHAPRAPWARLDLDVVSALMPGLGRVARNYTGISLLSDHGWPAPGPGFLDSG